MGGLDDVRSRLSEAVVVLDFDGSLAPIVEDPADARPLPAAASVLASLRPRVRRLAIATGRPAAFVRRHLDVPGLEIAGVYGLEDGNPQVAEGVRLAVAAALETEPGTHLEDKGVSLVVHTRRCADPDAAAERLRPSLADVAARAGMALLEGKRVYELAPPGGDKGAVVRRLAAGAGVVLVAGDDLGDLPAFEAARELEASGAHVWLVAVDGPETPVEVLDAADSVVDGPEGLLRLLASM